MFTKGSRYRKLPEVTASDARGRVLRSIALRPLPRTEGALLHTVRQGERHDLLANRYFRQPRKWWQICDANPEFLSPLALLGQEPISVATFALAAAPLGSLPSELAGELEHDTPSELLRQACIDLGVVLSESATLTRHDQRGRWWIADEPAGSYLVADVSDGLDVYLEQFPWAALLALLEATVGVEQIMVTDELQTEVESWDAALIAIDRHIRSVQVTFNRMNVTAEQLAEAMNTQIPGLVAGRPEQISRVGKQIAIPSDLPV
ncbi:hypothetical protein EYB53_020450 [Candidatus Chloroploca sp. M-50]|uniref:LysM domain-containing protein n=1 Tax=Candidatus Chloroploca mongolica TaxID=2528176 RepID=A0ABS4DF70_9CHLR|nr:hypothetical protein [Candidatus Chloroploca mongolica]MBP1468096.1 hypothetical protein [Candidatus Chloroploca mongolica]